VKILQIPDVLHEYLLHVIESHAARGIHPDESMALSHLWGAAKQVTTISDEEINKWGKDSLAALDPTVDGTPNEKGMEDPQQHQDLSRVANTRANLSKRAI
jgi:hypothetical protein